MNFFEQRHPANKPMPQQVALFLAVLAFVGSYAISVFAQTPPTATPKQAPTVTPKPRPTAPSVRALLAAPLKPEEINEARQLLDALGYWVIFAEEKVAGHSEQNGKFDASLRHALIAFQKLADRPRTGALTPEELQALRAAHRPVALESGYAHIEVDLLHQVLLVVDSCEACLHILSISSGSDVWFTEGGKTRRAVTPIGRFQVQRKIAGWRKSPLGLLYYPNYINRGIAIHGNPSVPAQPASHGCIRIPMFAAKAFAEMAVIGLPVIVHDGSLPAENPALPTINN